MRLKSKIENKIVILRVSMIKPSKLLLRIFLGCIAFSAMLLSQDNKILSIVVGSENAYKPFAYLDGQNNPVGFDNEVVKAIVSYIPNARLQIISVPWNVIFTGLDSGKFHIIANQITKNTQREEKYLFSSQPYFYGVSGLILGKNSKITDIKELKNVKIGVTVGSNHATNLEKYIKENPRQQIKIVYYKTSPALVADLANGRVEAIINDPISALDYAKSQNIELTVTNFRFEKTPIYLVFRKDSQELAQIINNALEKAIKDGAISKLSIKYFGIDQTK